MRSSGHCVDVFVRRALQVQPRDLRRAHAEEREAALVEAVDQLVGRRRGVGENAEPGERIDALVDPQLAAGIDGRQMPWNPSQPAMKSQSDLVRVRRLTKANLRRAESRS